VGQGVGRRALITCAKRELDEEGDVPACVAYGLAVQGLENSLFTPALVPIHVLGSFQIVKLCTGTGRNFI
jgi:hypothetical protein